MNKSQLRRMAADAADGNIPVSEYRARRRELIDNIVAGSEAIERLPPVWAARDNSAAGDDEVTTLNNRGGAISAEPESRRMALPLPALLGAGSLLCIIALVALLWPEEPAKHVALTPPPVVPAAEEIPPARGLVESFVARRDFTPEAIKLFQHDWQQLTAEQRESARGELWFSSLVRAIRDEVKTQKALAGLASGESAMTRAKAAFALGESLGISDQLPGIDDIASAAPMAAAAQSSVTEAKESDAATPTAAAPPPVESSPAASSQDNAAVVESAPKATPSKATSSTAKRPTGRQWLAAQNNGHLTLQIFAVNNLDRVEQLMGAHPGLDVHVLATEGAVPRYRVFHGVFRNEEQARQAYTVLPADILSASNGAIVKSFSVVHDDLRATSAAAKPGNASNTSEAYAVQVFATGNRTNAQALIRAFPALKLKLREITGDAAPYRVVYGQFASADLARSAASKLPQTLLSRIGTPLPKSISSLGTAVQP